MFRVPMPSRAVTVVSGLTLALIWGCSYHYVAGPLRPTETQGTEMTIADDGGVTFTQGRLEVRLRPVTADELNRQFAAVSERRPEVSLDEPPHESEASCHQEGVGELRRQAFPSLR